MLLIIFDSCDGGDIFRRVSTFSGEDLIDLFLQFIRNCVMIALVDG